MGDLSIFYCLFQFLSSALLSSYWENPPCSWLGILHDISFEDIVNCAAWLFSFSECLVCQKVNDFCMFNLYHILPIELTDIIVLRAVFLISRIILPLIRKKNEFSFLWLCFLLGIVGYFWSTRVEGVEAGNSVGMAVGTVGKALQEKTSMNQFDFIPTGKYIGLGSLRTNPSLH